MKLIMYKGLPASGKSTHAREEVLKSHGVIKRVNKDELRMLVDAGKWSSENEKTILKIRDIIVTTLLSEKFSVIVDDTNLHPKHEINLRKIAQEYGADFKIKDFTNISLEECLDRDYKRSVGKVGKKVILKMYNQYLKPTVQLIQYNQLNPDIIVCDLDGTIALFGDANPYERDFTKDKVNQVVKNILLNRGKSNVQVVFVSGRKDKFRKQTEEWLNKNWGTNYKLFMRKTARKDQQEPKDVVVKKEIYEKNLKGKYNILFILDDRNQVVEFWRSQGLTCLQVAEGDF